MERTSVLIISGYNHRAIVAFSRFCIESKVDFYIVAADNTDPILSTVYSSQVIVVRESKALSVEDFTTYYNIIAKKVDSAKVLILPSTEYLNRFLLKERNDLESLGFVVPLVDDHLYTKISDKYFFGELCEHFGIRVPKEYPNLSNCIFPFVAKPKQYFINGKLVNEKPFLVYTQKDFETLQTKLETTDYYFQEFVGGKSFYLLYYFAKDGSYQVYSQQNLIQQDKGLSIIAARSSDIHHEEIAEKFTRLFQSKGFFGLVMVEVKKSSGEYYMIEANPRLWGPSQLILDSGMNLFYLFAFDYSLLDPAKTSLPNYVVGTPYFWSGGIIEDDRNNYQSVFHQYSEQSFFEDYPALLSRDVYLKEDTIAIYIRESKKQ